MHFVTLLQSFRFPAAEFLLAKVQNFQKHDAAFQEKLFVSLAMDQSNEAAFLTRFSRFVVCFLQEKEEYSPVVTHKQLLQTLRTQFLHCLGLEWKLYL